MPATTARTLVTDAFVTVGIVGQGASISDALLQDGFRRLNLFIGGLALQSLGAPVASREVFPLTANVGIYTIGAGGDFDTERPVAIDGAAILLNNGRTPVAVTSITQSGITATVTTAANHGLITGQGVTIHGASPAAYSGTFTVTVTGLATFTYIFEGAATSATGTITAFVESNTATVVEIPCPVITDAAYQDNRIKSLTSTLPTWLYYSPTFQGDLGTVQIWPIPTVTTNALVIYRRQQLSRFVSLSATYYLPEGAEEAFSYGLARRLLTPFAVSDQQTVQDVKELARDTMATFKRINTRLTDLPNDWIQRGGWYSIITGQ